MLILVRIIGISKKKVYLNFHHRRRVEWIILYQHWHMTVDQYVFVEQMITSDGLWRWGFIVQFSTKAGRSWTSAFLCIRASMLSCCSLCHRQPFPHLPTSMTAMEALHRLHRAFVRAYLLGVRTPQNQGWCQILRSQFQQHSKPTQTYSSAQWVIAVVLNLLQIENWPSPVTQL